MAGLAGAGGAGGPLGGIGSLLAGKGVAAIVAGLLLGAASGGALVVSGAVHVGAGSGSSAGTGSQLSLVACPNQGPVIGSVSAGEQVLVTGRTADSAWLELYYPAPGITRAWTEAGPLQLQGSLTSLPVHACDAPSPSPSGILAVVSPSPAASPSPQVSLAPEVSPSPGLSPSPSPSPGPSATPNKGPTLGSLTASTKTLYYDPSSYCPRGTVESVTFSVSASDANGVGSVALFWKEPGGSYTQTAMSQSGSKWTATLSSAGNSINTAGTLTYYVQATDSQGATSKLPSSSVAGLTVKGCPNTGPTITSATSDVTSVDTNPLGTGDCSNGWALGTGITVKANDVDGVAGVTLYYTGPGLSGYKTQALSNQGVPGSWFGSINPGSLGITGNGTIHWYVIAVDSKGAQSQSKTYSITVHRCDTAATIRSSSPTNGEILTYCPQPPSNTNGVYVSFEFGYLLDPDGLTSVKVTYKIVDDQNGNAVTGSGSNSWSATTSGTKWSFNSSYLDGNSFYGQNTVTWTITTTDQYGGHTTQSYSVTIDVSSC